MTREEFLKSKDFMKLGQAINHKNWQVAGMTCMRLQKNAAEAGITEFTLNLTGLKQCIIHKEAKQALDILAVVVSKRVKMLNDLSKTQIQE